MANIDDGFRVETLSLDDQILVTSKIPDPSIGAGYEAPIGSIYARLNGLVYRKFGTADVDWVAIDGINSENVFDVMKEPTGHFNRNDSTMSFDPGTQTFTIQPLAPATGFDYYIHGVKFTVSSIKQVVIPNVSSLYFIYFDNLGNLLQTSSFSPDLLLNYAYTCVIYWNATTQEAVYFADERHGITMDGQTHLHFHVSLGTQYISGLALGDILADGDGSLETQVQYSVANGYIRDEDLGHNIYNTGGKVNVYDLEQALDPIAQLPVLFRMGAGAEWTAKSADNYPMIQNGTAGYVSTGRPAWNEFTGGAWQLSEVPNNHFFLIHIVATNDINHPIIALNGIREYQNKPAGRDAASLELDLLSGLPFAEFTPIATLIYQTANSYTNSVKSRIRSTDDGAPYIDWRDLSEFANTGGSGISDHGNLSGLNDDDHLQYHTDARASLWLATESIDTLGDVNTTTPADNNILAYDTTTSKWINQTANDAGISSITDLNNHINDATIHFTEGSISHLNIQDIGTNTHAQIDTHIADTTIHYPQSAILITESQISDLQPYLLDITGESINDLNNVLTTMTPIDGQVLTFDTTNGWQAETPIVGVTDHTLLTNIGTNTHAQIDAHIADSTIHFSVIDGLSDVAITTPANGQILTYNGATWVNSTPATGVTDHTLLSNIGTNTHAQIDTHIADTTIHFTEASISHLNIQDIGTNTHAQIDTHIADTNNPHQTSLDLLTDTDILTPVTGDTIIYNNVTGNWENSTISVPGQGKLLQVQFGPIAAVQGTAIIPDDATPPLITEGVPIWSQGITLSSTASKVRISTSISFTVSNAASSLVVAIFRDNTCVGVMSDTAANKDSMQTVTFTIYDLPNSTAPIVYSARVGKSSGNATWYINQDPNTTNVFNGLLSNNAFTVEEIAV